MLTAFFNFSSVWLAIAFSGFSWKTSGDSSNVNTFSETMKSAEKVWFDRYEFIYTVPNSRFYFDKGFTDIEQIKKAMSFGVDSEILYEVGI